MSSHSLPAVETMSLAARIRERDAIIAAGKARGVYTDAEVHRLAELGRYSYNAREYARRKGEPGDEREPIRGSMLSSGGQTEAIVPGPAADNLEGSVRYKRYTKMSSAMAQLRAKLLTYENKIVSGRVIEQDGMRNIYVKVLLDDMPDDQTVNGEYNGRHQTRKERGRYNTEDLYHFFVLKVSVSFQGYMPIINFALSRTSVELVKLLLLQYANEIKPDDYQIEVTCRIAGKVSHVNTNKLLPEAAIKKVAQELKERMVVEYDSPETPAEAETEGKATNEKE